MFELTYFLGNHQKNSCCLWGAGNLEYARQPGLDFCYVDYTLITNLMH